MKQHIAVKKMILSLKTEGLPNELCPLVRNYLQKMFVVGWEECRNELFKHQVRKLGQYNKDMILIETYNGINEACKITGFCKDTIYRSIKQDKNIKGYYWCYVNY
ncbi:MAG TPA: hypothetical protein VMV32_06435 [Ignavibacteriaceae bacterium]|nr:hypothetical protein [Ignavibacteriaceae bacterium]